MLNDGTLYAVFTTLMLTFFNSRYFYQHVKHWSSRTGIWLIFTSNFEACYLIWTREEKARAFCFRWCPESKTLCARQLFRHTNYSSDRGIILSRRWHIILKLTWSVVKKTHEFSCIFYTAFCNGIAWMTEPHNRSSVLRRTRTPVKTGLLLLNCFHIIFHKSR